MKTKKRAKSLQADQRKSSPFVDLFCRNLRKACACLGAFGRSPKVATRLAAFASFAAVSYQRQPHATVANDINLERRNIKITLGILSFSHVNIIVKK